MDIDWQSDTIFLKPCYDSSEIFWLNKAISLDNLVKVVGKMRTFYRLINDF